MENLWDMVRVEAVLTNFSFITTEFEKIGGEP